MPKYIRPVGFSGWLSDRVFNPLVATLTKLGLSLKGSAVLSVRGRKSGEWRSTPVNPLRLGNERYLVAPRGHTQWVRNIRVSGEGRLQVGRKITTIHVAELSDSEKVPVLRAYLNEWAWEAGQFFSLKDGAKASDEEIARVAPDHPVFRIESEETAKRS